MKDVLPYETPSKHGRRGRSTLAMLSFTLFFATIACASSGGWEMMMASAVVAAAGMAVGITSLLRSGRSALAWLGTSLNAMWLLGISHLLNF